MNVQHSSRSASWGTPTEVIKAVYNCLGHIDLDPASSPAFNETVRARRIITCAEDGLRCDWEIRGYERIFLNPPGGKTGNRSNTAIWWAKLVEQLENFDVAIFVGFSLECLQTTQKVGVQPILNFPFCVPERRLSFIREDGTARSAPSHSNVIALVSRSPDCWKEPFYASFRRFGYVKL